MYESATAMSGLSCFINVDLARDLANDIMTLVRNEFLCFLFNTKIFLDDINKTLYT
jgi:hypothetical protein